MSNAEIVVVGAGVAGLSAALAVAAIALIVVAKRMAEKMEAV